MPDCLSQSTDRFYVQLEFHISGADPSQHTLMAKLTLTYLTLWPWPLAFWAQRHSNSWSRSSFVSGCVALAGLIWCWVAKVHRYLTWLILRSHPTSRSFHNQYVSQTAYEHLLKFDKHIFANIVSAGQKLFGRFWRCDMDIWYLGPKTYGHVVWPMSVPVPCLLAIAWFAVES